MFCAVGGIVQGHLVKWACLLLAQLLEEAVPLPSVEGQVLTSITGQPAVVLPSTWWRGGEGRMMNRP